MIKRMIIVVLVMGAMFAAQAEAQAIFGGGAVSIGIREDEVHAGIQNFTSEVYVSDNDQRPVNMEPAYLQESNEERLALPNHIPKYPNEKVWFLIKSSLIGAQDIKSIELSFKTDNKASQPVVIQGELCGNQADFWIDMSQFKAGSYPMEVKVVHMGGQVTYQVLFFLIRSRKEVTDNRVYYLTVYNPERPYKPSEIELAPLMKGFEAGNSFDAFYQATNTTMTIVRAPSPTVASANALDQLNDKATVRVNVFADRNRTMPGSGTFRLVAEDGSYQSEYQSGSTLQFVVPSGRRYQLRSKRGKQWKLYNATNPISVSAVQITEVIIQRRGSR